MTGYCLGHCKLADTVLLNMPIGSLRVAPNGHLDSVEWNGGLEWWNGTVIRKFYLVIIKTIYFNV